MNIDLDYIKKNLEYISTKFLNIIISLHFGCEKKYITKILEYIWKRILEHRLYKKKFLNIYIKRILEYKFSLHFGCEKKNIYITKILEYIWKKILEYRLALYQKILEYISKKILEYISKKNS